MRIALFATMVLGCGDNLEGAADALPDAPEAPVAITVTRQSVPLADIPVIFHRADGTLVETRVTNSAGRAEARTGPGGFVTAVTSFAADRDVKTFAGVQPGDQLVLDGAPNASTPMTTYAVHVAQVAGAVFYRVGVRCLVGTGEQVGANTNPVILSVTTTCLAPTETLVTALDSFGFPIESVFGEEATPTDGGVVDLTNAVPSSAETATLTLANIDGGTLESSRVIGRIPFFAETEPVTNGNHPTVFPDHGGARQTIAIINTRSVFAWGESASMQTVDVAALQVAPVAEPSVDRATRTVSWSGAANANFVFGQLSVFGASPFLWSFSAPIAGTTLTLPALEDFAIDAAGGINVELGVARVVGEVVELRSDGAWLDANNGVMNRQRTLLTRVPATAGSAGTAFTSANLSF